MLVCMRECTARGIGCGLCRDCSDTLHGGELLESHLARPRLLLLLLADSRLTLRAPGQEDEDC